MQKYLVVSYDDDQQQWFWDYVVAKTTEDAGDLRCRSIGQLIHQFDTDTAEQTCDEGGNEQ